MIVNLLNNDYITEYRIMERTVKEIRKNYTGKAEDFPVYLETQGISVSGMQVIVADKWLTLDTLKR
jgi:hypothetical protein